MPIKKISSNKSSRRRLNTGSALNSKQEVTPVSAEVGTSSSSTLSVSLRGDTESAEEPSSFIGQPIMDTLGSVVSIQSSLVEPRINKRCDHSPSETSDGRADSSRGNPSNSNRGNPSVRGSPGDFLVSADHSMSLKDITQPDRAIKWFITKAIPYQMQSSSITTRRERWFSNLLLTSCRNFTTTTNT